MQIRPSYPLLLWGLLTALVVLLVDQASKRWMMDLLLDPWQQHNITAFFNLTPVWNRGVSFGLFAAGSSQGVLALLALAGIITLVLLGWLVKSKTRPQAICLGLIIGGAIGNSIDRILYSAVFDFLDFHAFGYHWPAFNVADSCIVIGVAVLVLCAQKPQESSHHATISD